LYESLPTSAVYKILNKFRKTNSFVKLEQYGKKYEKMTPEIKEFVQNQVDENCTITLKNVKKLIFLNFR